MLAICCVERTLGLEVALPSVKKLLQVFAVAFFAGVSLIGCSLPPEPPKAPQQSQPSPAQMTPGQKFLKAKLAELDSIRQTPEFRKYKLSASGPYAGWVADLKSEAEKMDLGMWEMGGVNFLALLASNYASTDGAGDDSTEQVRNHVQEVIDTPQ